MEIEVPALWREFEKCTVYFAIISPLLTALGLLESLLFPDFISGHLCPDFFKKPKSEIAHP